MEANSREYQRQAIDAEIKTLEDSEESIRALKHRRNTFAPISSLPTEVITSIFFILRFSAQPLTGGKWNRLAWLCVTHVCHQWREIALNNPLFWSHINFNIITLAGAAEMLVRAKKAPLHLVAWVPGHQQDDARFGAFKRELQSRVSYISHLRIRAGPVFLCRAFEHLASPAPTLESLTLFVNAEHRPGTLSRASIPDTLFDGTAPRLSYLELHECDISWKSPLLKGLRHLEIRSPPGHVRPSLVDWLNTLDELPQLTKLILHSASPIAPPFPLDVERTVTLSFLTYLDISASVGDCALALSHLILPALTQLCIEANSVLLNGGDVLKLLPYVTRHSHGPQDTQPLQNVAIRGRRRVVEIHAWPDMHGSAPFYYPFHFVTDLSAPRVALYVMCNDWIINTHIELLSAATTALPQGNLLKLTTEPCEARLDKVFWCNVTPRWPLLECVRLAPLSVRGFAEMILEDNGGHENPLLPSLTNLALPSSTLTTPRTLRLCDTLMKRVEQGVPVEVLDLETCSATSYAVQLLSEIVASVLSPGDLDDDSDSYYETNDPRYYNDSDDEGDEGEMDGSGEEEEDYLVMDED